LKWMHQRVPDFDLQKALQVAAASDTVTRDCLLASVGARVHTRARVHAHKESESESESKSESESESYSNSLRRST
jgi:hypothetical protein